MAHRQGYSGLQIALHWTIAALVVFQLIVNDAMPDAFHERLEGAPLSNDEQLFSTIHIAVGVTILLLAVVRLIVRLTRGVPAVHRDKPLALVYLAYATHVALYGFILVMPLAGALAWFGMLEDVGHIHAFAGTVLIPLIALHAIGGLAEHFVFRNDTLKRMLFPEKHRRETAGLPPVKTT
jgi:cytochrome b561